MEERKKERHSLYIVKVDRIGCSERSIGVELNLVYEIINMGDDVVQKSTN